MVDQVLLARFCIEAALRSPCLLPMWNLARPATFEFAERDRRPGPEHVCNDGPKDRTERAPRGSHVARRRSAAAGGPDSVGTSGWSYRSWRGPFFPERLAAKHHLEYYASQFETAELNGVFYRTPTPAAVEGWRDQTGPGFVFAWKASKFITHWKRLSQNSVNSLELLEKRLSILGGKAGPVLFQLPPNFEADAARLAAFLALLPKGRRYSFEFRHPSWYATEHPRAIIRPQHSALHFGSS